MTAAMRAGALYFLLIFGLGFLLGTARVLAVEPRLGAMAATLVELPAMLVFAWFACGWTVRRLGVAAAPAPRLAMGAAAFLLLIAAETVLGVLGFGRSLADQAAAFASAPGLAGLAAQALATLAFPVLVRRR